VTNFDFVRSEDRLAALIAQLKNRRVWGVVDESIRIKGPKSAQTKAMLKLAPYCVRRTILNGTPVGNNPLDLWAQFEYLDPRIIGAKNFFHFRAAYAVMGGYLGKQVLGFQRLEELQRRIAPYVLRRLKEDCLDLPAKTYTVREARLTPATWRLYKSMRDECVAFLDQATAATAPQAVVRLLRLAQITAGFVGGVESIDAPDLLTEPIIGSHFPTTSMHEVGSEKLAVTLESLADLFETDEPRVRVLIWCRFRAELDRLAKAIAERWPDVRVGRIEGRQSETERRSVVSAFQADGDDRMVLLGNPQAGGLGLTLTAAHHVIYASNDYNLVTRLQSEDRVHRPGQRSTVLYTDVIATGPDGQKTIDSIIVTALRKKQDLATWTTDAWRHALTSL
jgi:SNF2 family DNA or RNA helicase